MRRTYGQHTKTKDANCLGRWCLLVGPEQRLKREALSRIRGEAQAAAGMGEEPGWEVIDGPSATARDVLARSQTGALFGGARVVVMREADRMEESEQKALAAAVGPLPEGVGVVLVTGESRDRRRPRDVRKPLREAIAASGLVIDFPALKAGEAAAWAISLAAELGAKLEPAAARKLVEQKVGTGLSALGAEVEKLALFVGPGKTIKVAHVDEVTPRLVEEDIFRLMDAVGRRESGRAVAILRELLGERREPPARVLAMLARSVRQVWQVKLLTERGWRPGREADDEVAALLPQDPRKNALAQLGGRQAWLAERLAGQAGALTWSQLARAVKALHGCDLALKGIRGSANDDSMALELLVIQLCTGVEMPRWEARGTAAPRD